MAKPDIVNPLGPRMPAALMLHNDDHYKLMIAADLFARKRNGEPITSIEDENIARSQAIQSVKEAEILVKAWTDLQNINTPVNNLDLKL